ncbi:MAG: tetratricopeptide repeat protein [Cyanobacteria bacterium REEB67]|nr:tetratricopeptide repeat protein [Cyanobacteria bacterium REEB67]
MAPTSAEAQNSPRSGPSVIPANLTPQQKLVRDKFIYKKLEQVDALIKQGHAVQARQIMKELILLDPNPYSSNVHFTLAESCYQLGNNQEAIKHYQLALRYSTGNNTSIYWNIALAYMNMSDYEQASVWARRLLSKNPNAEMRRRAERFLADIGEQQNIQKDVSQHLDSSSTTGSGDYLAYLQANKDINRWPREKLPIKVFIEDDRRVPGFKTAYVSIFLECLEAWTKASKNHLSFQIVNSLEQADLNLIFTANVNDIAQKPGMAPTELGLATTTAYQGEGPYGTIEKSKIQILTHESASNKQLSDDQVKRVCLHEIGHALGLSGHSPNDSDIMHFAMSYRQLPALTKQDKQTIARLYQDYPSSSQLAASQYQPARDTTSPFQSPSQPQFQPTQQTQKLEEQLQQLEGQH